MTNYVLLNGTPIKVIHSDSTAVSAKPDGRLHPLVFIAETFGNVVFAVVLLEHPTLHCAGINTGLLIACSSGGRNRHVSVLFSMYTSEIIGRGNQPQGWEIPMFPPSKYILDFKQARGERGSQEGFQNFVLYIASWMYEQVYSLHEHELASVQSP